MARIVIPAAVMRHWSRRLDEIERLGPLQRGDATYVKALQRRSDRTVCIDADAADLAELAEECHAWLDGGTDVGGGNRREDIVFRMGYRRLRESVWQALGSTDAS